jgi:predicted flavoprotein YhiN
MQAVDVIVVGAGAAGLFCAGLAGQRGLRVLLIDHAPKVAEKVRISGGGRCNFTNRDCSAANFLSDNPAFCRSALARYRPADFIALVDRYHITHHEKHRGQLFCDGPSEQIVRMLLSECSAGAVQHWQPCEIHAANQSDGGFDALRGRQHTQRCEEREGMTKQAKLKALIKDLTKVAKKHKMVLDKYSKDNDATQYFFKLQFEDVQVNLEDVFHPVRHRIPN